MIFWRGLPASFVIHLVAVGIVSAHVVSRGDVAEDVPSLPVELVLDIDSSPVPQQAAAVESPGEAEAEEVAAEPPAPVADTLPPDPPAPPAAPQPVDVPSPPQPEPAPPQLAELQSPTADEALPLPLRERADMPPPPLRPAAAESQPVKPAARTAAKPPPQEQVQKKKVSRQRKSIKQVAALAAGKGSTGQVRSTDGRALEQSYKSKVLARLRSAKRYPEAARRKGAEGTAVLSFTIDATGRLTAARISGHSGEAEIDRAAIAMARAAAPFPPFPPGLGRQQMTFRVPVQFTID